MTIDELTLADNSADLRRGLASLTDLAVVGVDVERADWNRYYRAAALVQLGGEGRVLIVDPLAIHDLTPVDAFLRDRLAVFHAVDNDLGPLATLEVAPSAVEDTSIAAAMLGLPTGLETLLRDLLGIDLPQNKQAMQRADWESRPLPAEMLAYAGADVAHLPALWARLHTHLQEAGREDWYHQELAAILALPPAEERRAWTRTRGAGRLSRDAQARLRGLWHSREELARETDTAPGLILDDRTLVELAASPPASEAELTRRGMRRQAARRFGAQLLAALSAAQAAAENARADRPLPRAPTEEDRAKADVLRALRSDRARQLGIDPGVLCPSRKLITGVLADPRSPEDLREALHLKPWQWGQLADVFCEALGIDRPGTPVGDLPASDHEERIMAERLNPDALHQTIAKLDGWDGTVDRIERTYEFTDFADAMQFVNRVAELAERANHHPDIHVSWNKVTLVLTTHSAGGVTQRDIELAQQIDGTEAR
jgi:ribonuclease D